LIKERLAKLPVLWDTAKTFYRGVMGDLKFEQDSLEVLVAVWLATAVSLPLFVHDKLDLPETNS
jgi:hypothetical protein